MNHPRDIMEGTLSVIFAALFTYLAVRGLILGEIRAPGRSLPVGWRLHRREFLFTLLLYTFTACLGVPDVSRFVRRLAAR